jgi:hypothetical protein
MGVPPLLAEIGSVHLKANGINVTGPHRVPGTAPGRRFRLVHSVRPRLCEICVRGHRFVGPSGFYLRSINCMSSVLGHYHPTRDA